MPKATKQTEDDKPQSKRRQEVVRRSARIHLHYHGPVNHVEKAYNGNFATNYGSISQSVNVPSLQVDGGPSGSRPITPRPNLTPLLDPILDASHTRNKKLSPPNSQCFPGTRKKVLEEIKTWAGSELDPDTPHSLWVFGYAGCGKSAIAQAIAEEFARSKLLAGSFFFFRGSGDRGTVVRFITTIASQLASAIPEVAVIIETVLRDTPGLATTATSSLTAQYEHLIFDPLIAVAHLCRAPYLIVLDAVDECKDSEDVASFIQDMLDLFDRHPLIPLRFLITSRVEDHLHQVLHSSNQVQLLNLVERTTDEDIAAALDVAIADAKRGRLLACEANWPSPKDREALVRHIGKSFIFMTTIVKLLFDTSAKDGITPMERLPKLLKMKPEFDTLYKEILTPCQGIRNFQDVISTVALAFEPLSISQLAVMLKIGSADVVNVLIHLHAIIQVPDDDHIPVTLWHTSLRDFLCNKRRSGEMYATAAHDCRMGLRCTTLAAPDSEAGTQLSGYSRRYALQHISRALAKLGSPITPKPLERKCHLLASIFELPIFEHNSQSICALDVAYLTYDRPLIDLLEQSGVDTKTSSIDWRLKPILYGNGSGRPGLVNELLDKGVDPNTVSACFSGDVTSYRSPIAMAAYHNDADLIRRMLECEADPNGPSGISGKPLNAACVSQSLEAAKVLLEAGADPNDIGGAWGPYLHRCARWDYPDIAQALLEHGANPNLQYRGGRTPLHEACYQGNISIVKLLLEFGADATIKDYRGWTPLQQARISEKDDIVQLLEERGIVE